MSEGKSNRGRALLVPALVLLLAGVVVWRVTRKPVVLSARPSEATAPEPVLDRAGWQRRFRETQDGAEQQATFQAAAAKGNPDAAAFLGEVASSGDRMARAAAEALGRVSNPAARPTLLGLAKSSQILAAANAIRALGNIASPEDVPFLREVVDTQRGTRLWQEAVRALGKIRTPAARERIESALEESQDEQERLTALSALQESARPESVEALERYLARGGLTQNERLYAQNALEACRRK